MKNKIQEKKAILFSEALKIIVAVLCIIALIYLAFQLYTLFSFKTENEQAKANLKKIVDAVDELGVGKEKELTLIGLKIWSIVFFEKNKDMPSSCSKEKNCLCICLNDVGIKPEVALESCEAEGVCESVEDNFKLIVQDNFVIQRNYISMRDAAKELFISRKQDYVQMSNIKSGEETGLLDGFLDKEYEFMDKGKMKIREQITMYILKRHGIDADRNVAISVEEPLADNIREAFKDLEYMAAVEIGLGNLQMGYDMAIFVGKDKLKEGINYNNEKARLVGVPLVIKSDEIKEKTGSEQITIRVLWIDNKPDKRYIAR